MKHMNTIWGLTTVASLSFIASFFILEPRFCNHGDYEPSPYGEAGYEYDPDPGSRYSRDRCPGAHWIEECDVNMVGTAAGFERHQICRCVSTGGE